MVDEQPEQLAEKNINLVYGVIARDFPSFIRDEDVIQSGMLGLSKAANTWDESKGVFSTFAWKCIRNEICRELRSRMRNTPAVSLDTPIAEDLTLGDTVEGESGIDYVDDSFQMHLPEDERQIYYMTVNGYSVRSIAEVTGYSEQKVRAMRRTIRLKWRKYYNND
jgi:RNA polymerase sigma factor (sigma-70 family)